MEHIDRPCIATTTLSFFGKLARWRKREREPMRRRLSVLGATILLVAAMLVASTPPLFAEDGVARRGRTKPGSMPG